MGSRPVVLTMTDGPSHDEIAADLYEAYESGTPISPVRMERDLTVSEGYAIQSDVVDRRTETEGSRVGYKVGFTSAAIRDEMDIQEPAYGHVLAGTVRSGGRVDVGPLVEPKVEAELAFRFGEPVKPPATGADVLSATSAVVPAVEIVDSRIEDWDVTAPEAIADNALSGLVVLGDVARDPTALDVDLALEGVEVRRNGVRRATGVGADVLGHPATVVEWLAGALEERGAALAAGDLVLTGSMTPLVPLEPGDAVEVRFADFGTVSVHGR
jgi:2-keto-4-pentenoate hydratase